MQKDKIFSLLCLLTTAELNDFEKFLRKRYAKNNRLQQVFSYLKKFHPVYDSPVLEKTQIIKKIFKRNKITVKSLSNIYHQLMTALEEFLLLKEIDKNSFARNYLFLQVLKKRNASELFLQKIEESKSQLEETKNETGIGIGFLYKKMILHYANYFHSHSDQFLLVNGAEELAHLKNSLDNASEIAHLKYECELHNRHHMLKENTAVTDDAKKNKENEILKDLYTNTLKLIKQRDDTDFFKVFDLLKKAKDIVHKSEQAIILNYLTNHAVSSIKRGKLTDTEQLFELYAFGLENQILIIDGFISSSRFQNIVNLSSFLGKYEWLNIFVTEYNKNLSNESRDNILKLSDAQIAFERNEYDNVLGILNDVKFENIYFLLRGKSLILRSYVAEEKPTNLILDFTRAFKEQLKRNKFLSEKIKISYLNFLATITKMQADKNKEDLLAYLNKFELLQFKSWLMEIINKRKN
ncbi:MAG: hypothetical protein AAFZ15_19805 [Bacteroidota bacterium]